MIVQRLSAVTLRNNSRERLVAQYPDFTPRCPTGCVGGGHSRTKRPPWREPHGFPVHLPRALLEGLL
jgi:hypothetical protein